MWTWPTSAALADLTSRFAKVATGVGAGFWLGANVEMLEGSGGGELGGQVDAAAWVVGGMILISIVNVAGQINGRIEMRLPRGLQARSTPQVAWGSNGWRVTGGNQLVRYGMGPIESDILILAVTGGTLSQSEGANLTATS